MVPSPQTVASPNKQYEPMGHGSMVPEPSQLKPGKQNVGLVVPGGQYMPLKDGYKD